MLLEVEEKAAWVVVFLAKKPSVLSSSFRSELGIAITAIYNLITSTNVQKLDVPGPDEKFCLCWLCAFTKFSSGGAIFPVHLIFEHLYLADFLAIQLQ